MNISTNPSFSRPAFSDRWFAGKQWNAPTCCCVTWEIDEYDVSTNRTVPYVGSRYWHLIDTSQWTAYNPYPVYRSARRQYVFRCSDGNHFPLPKFYFPCLSATKIYLDPSDHVAPTLASSQLQR
ncbi:hypothetical protein EDD85DRAFT_786727 [Armillaria nabsnona]|nr:hypothetical protein EDD85DRAFT_786727 [Armillaria nabsnona]